MVQNFHKPDAQFINENWFNLTAPLPRWDLKTLQVQKIAALQHYVETFV
jgi:hypothetical protein